MNQKMIAAVCMVAPVAALAANNNVFNPQISLVLQGGYNAYQNDPANYQLPGFALGEEAGLAPEGFSLDESEITLGANVDPQFYAQMTFALADDGGATEVETEEAYVQTLALGNGLSLKAGRFFSALGYLNEKHAHAWNFNDAPLVYSGLLGGQLKNDGAQVNWILPTDSFMQLGAELGNGNNFPAAGQQSGTGSWMLYANTGGDIGDSHSWQLGVSHWQADDVTGRESQGLNTPQFTGDSQIDAVDMVYKWAPGGNALERQFTLLFELFSRQEDGVVDLVDTAQTSSYSGDQRGGYVEAVYQFRPQWQLGARYDRLQSSNRGSDTAVLSDAGLVSNGHTPSRSSVMLAWLPSEFSRLRWQINFDDSTPDSDRQISLQYTMAIGAHGAHSY